MRIKKNINLGIISWSNTIILQTNIIQTVWQKVMELPNQDFGGEKVERTVTVLNIIQVYTYILKQSHKRWRDKTTLKCKKNKMINS